MEAGIPVINVDREFNSPFAAQATVLGDNYGMGVSAGQYICEQVGDQPDAVVAEIADRKSTRLNSSHANISYAVFCLKKKKDHTHSLHSPARGSLICYYASPYLLCTVCLLAARIQPLTDMCIHTLSRGSHPRSDLPHC